MAKIHVLSIKPLVSEHEIQTMFEVFGNIESINVISPLPGSAFKSAIIHYSEQRAAAKAVERLNKASTNIGKLDILSFDLGGLPTHAFPESSSLKPLDQQTLVLVKNFKNLIDERKLKELFQLFGEIKSVSIKKENNKSLGYGFVDFVHHSAAENAIAGMNGFLVKGRKLEVAFVESKEKRRQLCQNNFQTQSDNRKKGSFVLYVSNLHKHTTEKQLTELFQRFGNILSVNVREPHEGKSTTVGFVGFEKQDDALSAIMKMDGQSVNSLPIKVVFKHSK